MNHWNKDCDCKRKIIDFDLIVFKINGSRIDLQCIICNGMIGWWHTNTEKIMPPKRKWSKEECEALQ
jgi:hypothetical protein